MTDRPITFPAVAFVADETLSPAGEGLVELREWADLAEGEREEATARLSWEIIDSAGARWRMVEAPLLGPRKGLFGRSRTYFVFAPRFERLPKLSLDAFKARACAAIMADPDYFADDEVVAGEANEPIETQDLLEARCKRVRKARTNARVIAAIGLASEDLDGVTPYSEAERAQRRREYVVFLLVSGGVVAAILISLFWLVPMLPKAISDALYLIMALLIAGGSWYATVKEWLEKRRRRRAAPP